MMHSNAALSNMLRAQLVEIDKQMEAIKRNFLNTLPVSVKPDDDMVFANFRSFDGKPVLADMLAARASVLAAMANLRLEAAMTRNGGRPARGSWG